MRTDIAVFHLKTAERIAAMVGCNVSDVFLPERFTVSKTEDSPHGKPPPAEWAGGGEWGQKQRWQCEHPASQASP